MALTAEGKRLTEKHRREQIAVGARAEIQARLLWPSLRVGDLDRSEAAWMPMMLAVTEGAYSESAALATTYVDGYRQAEIGRPAAPVSPGFDRTAHMSALHLAGPVRVKLLIEGGMSPDAAHAQAFTKFAGIVRRQTLLGGRATVNATARVDRRAIGWRRVTDGDPCAFCAMLASRGPVYSSRSRAEVVAGSGLRYHGHCGCTGEIVYDEWVPNEAEARYIEAYEQAAAEAEAAGYSRTQDSVLWRMRRDGGFRDSPRTTTPG